MKAGPFVPYDIVPYGDQFEFMVEGTVCLVDEPATWGQQVPIDPRHHFDLEVDPQYLTLMNSTSGSPYLRCIYSWPPGFFVDKVLPPLTSITDKLMALDGSTPALISTGDHIRVSGVLCQVTDVNRPIFTQANEYFPIYLALWPFDPETIEIRPPAFTPKQASQLQAKMAGEAAISIRTPMFENHFAQNWANNILDGIQGTIAIDDDGGNYHNQLSVTFTVYAPDLIHEGEPVQFRPCKKLLECLEEVDSSSSNVIHIIGEPIVTDTGGYFQVNVTVNAKPNFPSGNPQFADPLTVGEWFQATYKVHWNPRLIDPRINEEPTGDPDLIVTVNETGDFKLRVTNICDDVVNQLKVIPAANTNGHITVDFPNTGNLVPACETISLTVHFSSDQVGVYTNIITLTSNDPANVSLNLPLTVLVNPKPGSGDGTGEPKKDRQKDISDMKRLKEPIDIPPWKQNQIGVPKIGLINSGLSHTFIGKSEGIHGRTFISASERPSVGDLAFQDPPTALQVIDPSGKDPAKADLQGGG